MLSRSSSNLSIAMVSFPQNTIRCRYYSPVEPKFNKTHTQTYECASWGRILVPSEKNRKRCAAICWSLVRASRRRVPLLIILNTLFRLSRSLEMHSKRSYKICIPRSVILGNLECCRNYKDFSIQSYFPEKFRGNSTLHESENFSDSFLHHILQSKKFRFSFSTKYDLGREMWKIVPPEL